ncbi:MAG: glycosyltransferase family 2 protein [Roseburia hominis]
MNPTVSIIVPVYNAKNYLQRCIDSILHQEYTDYELFLVDDGSTDGSGDICDAYAAADARITVIHKENTGVSDSRNLAISQARGTYLQFLDSDDWITPDATKLFVRAATEHDCDLVIADFYRVVGERVSHKGDIEDDGVLTREEFAAHMMENPADFYYGVLWNKLYRRDLVEKYHLRMDVSVNWCEDFLFNLEYILHANVFYALQAPVYYYVKTKGSLASQGLSITKTVKMKFMVFEYYNEFYKNVYDEKAYEKKRLSVYRFFLDAASDGTVPPTLLPGAKSSAQSASWSVLPRSPERVSYRSSTGAASFWTAVWRRSPCAMI